MKTILIIGGAGYIGSHVTKQLSKKGYKTVVLDNLSRGHQEAVVAGDFIQGDMSDPVCLSQVMQNYNFDAVMHFAALTNIGESVVDPAKYYHNNVAATLTLLNAMRKHAIPIFIFSSSAAIFGEPLEKRITESHPCSPINPYGQTKLIVEKILVDYETAYSIRSCCLRYFNAAGGDPDKDIKYFPRKESNLIPLILKSIPDGQVSIYGTDYPTIDGTCVRDYVHILDLGDAHIAAMEQLFEGKASSRYNLGNGNGFSVKEVIAAAEKVTGRKISVAIGPRRPGDPPTLVADSAKARRELNWQPRYPSLEDMIQHAWDVR